MSHYRVAVNLELTSKCNARCVMCPREAVPHPRAMRLETLRQAVARLSPGDLFRTVIAGYGEPTTHPQFEACLPILSRAAVPVDMVSNGQLLDRKRLQRIDGVFGKLIVSFSSIVPPVYAAVHVHLDQRRVMENIALAQQLLKSTRLVISLTPLASCIETLPETIGWLRAQGVEHLSMSPTLYDRAGALDGADGQGHSLRRIIREYGLRSQELDFIPSLRELCAQWRCNRFKCIPRNTDLVIAADGSYQYCFNDMGHSHPLGHVSEMEIRTALKVREAMRENPDLCGGCSLRNRYRPLELARALYGYLRSRG